MRSLRARLIGLWVLSLGASVAVGLLLVQLSQSSTQAQVGRAAAVVARACDLIGSRYAFYVTDWTGPVPPFTDPRLRSDLTAVVSVALSGENGVEGGIWQVAAGPLAYAYPTYEGSGPKTDLPAAEREQIQAVNQRAAGEEQAADWKAVASTQTLLLHACPLPGPIPGLTAWTMTRVQAARGLRPLELGLGVLMALMLLLSGWIGRMLIIWARHIGGIEAALSRSTGVPVVPRTGERELDRIIDALNDAGRRLADAHQQSDAMAARVALAERLAGLGRMAAGVAHEIRNPLAAARLQGENALAGDDARRRAAIAAMLNQIDRLDGLTGELLAMTQRSDPAPRPVDLSSFIRDAVGRHQLAADQRSVALTAEVHPGGVCVIDPDMVSRIVDNLLANAIRHAGPDGTVAVVASVQGGSLILTVEDDGDGVPADVAGHVFEPFVTGRPDGTGIGLAIARELADAHGGRLVLRRAKGTDGLGGALFALELPCRPS